MTDPLLEALAVAIGTFKWRSLGIQWHELDYQEQNRCLSQAEDFHILLLQQGWTLSRVGHDVG